jgi:hypothetical protein
MHERCSACGVLFLRNQGDLWFFLLIIDRVPIFLGIVALYFGFRSTSWIGGAGFFIALFVPLFATMRERQGLALAVDYLARIYLPDPSDEIHDGRELVVNVNREPPSATPPPTPPRAR